MTDLNEAGPCDCIEKTNEFLSAHNAKIMQAICFGKSDMGGLSPPLIELEKLDAKKRQKPPLMVASFCPFCGKKYRKDQPHD